MHLTVAICTYNRAAILRQTLAEMARLVPPPDDWTWDLVVVDNDSTDDTAAVIDAARARLPIQRVFERRKGVSRARNAAVHAARGDYILWTDDDVLVDSRWMVEYVAAIRRHPDAAFFGGPVEPCFEPPTPPWLFDILPHLKAVYAVRELDASCAQITPDTLPWGPNFAIAADAQRRHGFDPELGHLGRRVMLGEETNMLHNVLSDGGTGWWVPAARVRHFIPRHRQTWQYLSTYWHAQGVWAGRQIPPDDTPKFLERPLWLWNRAFRQQLMYAIARLRYSRVELTGEFADTRRAWGALSGYGAASELPRAGTSRAS